MCEITHALHWKREEDSSFFRNSWEQTRLLASYIISPYTKEKIRSLQTFMPLPWDKQGAKSMTEEDKAKMRETLRKLDEMHQKEIANGE